MYHAMEKIHIQNAVPMYKSNIVVTCYSFGIMMDNEQQRLHAHRPHYYFGFGLNSNVSVIRAGN